MQIVADLPHATKQELGYTAEEFILDCEFAGSKCKVRYVGGISQLCTQRVDNVHTAEGGQGPMCIGAVRGKGPMCIGAERGKGLMCISAERGKGPMCKGAERGKGPMCIGAERGKGLRYISAERGKGPMCIGAESGKGPMRTGGIKSRPRICTKCRFI